MMPTRDEILNRICFEEERKNCDGCAGQAECERCLVMIRQWILNNKKDIINKIRKFLDELEQQGE